MTLSQGILKVLKESFGEDFIEESNFKVEVGVRLVIKHTGEERSLAEIANALSSIPNVKVVDVKDSRSFAIELPGQVSALQKQIAAEISVPFAILQTDSVGPKVGAELRQQRQQLAHRRRVHLVTALGRGNGEQVARGGGACGGA